MIRRLLLGDPPTGDYECLACGERFELDRQVCPACGSFRIARTEYGDLLVD